MDFNILGTLGGVVLGFLLGAVWNWWRHRREIKGMRRAICTELSLTLAIVNAPVGNQSVKRQILGLEHATRTPMYDANIGQLASSLKATEIEALHAAHVMIKSIHEATQDLKDMPADQISQDGIDDNLRRGISERVTYALSVMKYKRE